jgi:hypothetical protein
MRITIAIFAALALTGAAHAVSVWDLQAKCGDDAKAYCKGVGYGDAMQECLNKYKKQLSAPCKLLVDRINGGEKVSLF